MRTGIVEGVVKVVKLLGWLWECLGGLLDVLELLVSPGELLLLSSVVTWPGHDEDELVTRDGSRV